MLCCYSSCTYLLSQILIDFKTFLLLCLEMHEKLEPFFHSDVSGSISLLRLKVFFTPSTLCSFLWIAVFKRWLFCCHVTISASGKYSLKVHTSLTGAVHNSPSQTGCNVIFGETIRSEIEKRLLFIFMNYSTVLDIFIILS